MTRRKVISTLLENARRAIPAQYGEHGRECSEFLARYRAFLAHNQLESALNTLEHLGHLISIRGDFWLQLQEAAKTMGLTQRLPTLQEAYSPAPEPSQSGS